jgi:hypothetical protein
VTIYCIIKVEIPYPRSCGMLNRAPASSPPVVVSVESRPEGGDRLRPVVGIAPVGSEDQRVEL